MSLAQAPVRLSPEETRARLIRWSCGAGAAGGEAGETARIVADYLRHGLCHVGSEEGGGTQSVHIHQLLSGLRRQLSPWITEPDLPPWVSPAEARPAPKDEEPDATAHLGVKDFALHVLRKLELLGECGHRGGGFYLATPTRDVSLPSGAALVVSGMPTSELATVIGVQPGWPGLARALSAAQVAELPTGIPCQDLSRWAGIPAEPLDVWTGRLLNEASQKAASTVGLDPASFEIYAPHLQRKQGQRLRWVPPRSWRRVPGAAEAPLCLCRTRARPYRFWLAPLFDGAQGTHYRREWPVRPEWARRLQYGIDQLYGLPVTARVYSVSRGHSGEREVRLDSWPAWEEYQALSALAYDSTPPEGPYLPALFRVARAWWPDMRNLLAGISIRIREES